MSKKDNTPKQEEHANSTELTELEQKCGEYLAGWQRAQADYQNLKKESAKDRELFVKYANANLIMELLPILDNFKAAYKQIPENEQGSAWVIGFSFIKKQLEDFLKANGVEEIKSVGEKFDYAFHDAVGKRIEAGVAEDIILEEKKAGYTLNGKVIQAAKVVVCESEGG